MCTNCNRLSNDIRVCDKCGSTLSEDVTLCISSDSKKLHLDHGATNLRPIVAKTSSTVSAYSVAGIGNSDTILRPVAHANATSNILGSTQFVISNSVASSSLPPGNLSVVSASPNQSTAANLVIQLAVANEEGSVKTQSVHNLLTPIVNGSHNSSVSSVVPSTAILMSSTRSERGDNVFMQAEPLRQELSISAYEIRIGEKKFKSLSSVNFKQDGILFTLKGM